MHRLPRPRERSAAAHVAGAALIVTLATSLSMPAHGIAATRVAATRAAAGDVATHAAGTRRAPRGGFAPGEVVVGYGAEHENATEARAGAASAEGRTRVLTLHDGEAVPAAIARLRKRGDVRFAVPDYVAHAAGVAGAAGVAHAASAAGVASAGYVPDDPGKSSEPGGWEKVQWNFAGRYGVEAPIAWEHLIDDGAPGGSGTTVAVLDTGVAYETREGYARSPDFEAGEFVSGYDFVANTSHPDDQNGHGTFVAGTIAEATNNGIGLTGLAYGAKIMPVRVLDARGEGDASTIAEGVRFAVNHGAQVINMSLVFSASVTAADIPELTSALTYAHEHDVVVVAAAGNKASSEIPYPARDRYVISVGATTEDGCLAKYSNYGGEVDIVAPGGGRNARLPGDADCTIQGSGRDVFQETFLGTSPSVFGLPGNYKGTSMATPDVSATAALVIASGVLGTNPTPAAVRYRLEQTARPLGAPQDEADYGHGLVDAATATAPGGPGAVSASSASSARAASRARRRKQRARARRRAG
jgi:serine protease